MSNDLTKSVPVQITEDEAAVYDRQIRLWGIEAQQRMRNATILVVRLQGTATETIKNIVLAGIGKLIIVDGENVTEEDLGAGFFFRDGDVGKKRVDAAKARVESLNPLVTVETLSDESVLDGTRITNLIGGVDLVCMTDSSREETIRVNEVCRRNSKPFYAGGTFGLLGYIMCDLVRHDFVAPDKSAPKESPRNIKVTVSYPPLQDALQFKWSKLNKRETKTRNPACAFSILAVWEYQSLHDGQLPDSPDDTDELRKIFNRLLTESEVNTKFMVPVPPERHSSTATTAAHEFSPVCAIVGGMLAQDILKALAAREPPISNLFVFDGISGGATVCPMNMS